MKRFFVIIVSGLWLLASPSAFAILDTNNNGLSDLWERAYNNGQLFPQGFDPQADPDGDGWTNVQEAVAGTDPFNPNPHDGLVRLETTHIPAVLSEPDEFGESYFITPEAVTVTWPTLLGKQYTLSFSTDLTQASWIPVGVPIISGGGAITFGFEIGGTDKLFWRVAVTDVDTDTDGLTNHEEHQLGTDLTKSTRMATAFPTMMKPTTAPTLTKIPAPTASTGMAIHSPMPKTPTRTIRPSAGNAHPKAAMPSLSYLSCRAQLPIPLPVEDPLNPSRLTLGKTAMSSPTTLPPGAGISTSLPTPTSGTRQPTAGATISVPPPATDLKYTATPSRQRATSSPAAIVLWPRRAEAPQKAPATLLSLAVGSRRRTETMDHSSTTGRNAPMTG